MTTELTTNEKYTKPHKNYLDQKQTGLEKTAKKT